PRLRIQLRARCQPIPPVDQKPVLRPVLVRFQGRARLHHHLGRVWVPAAPARHPPRARCPIPRRQRLRVVQRRHLVSIPQAFLPLALPPLVPVGGDVIQPPLPIAGGG